MHLRGIPDHNLGPFHAGDDDEAAVVTVDDCMVVGGRGVVGGGDVVVVVVVGGGDVVVVVVVGGAVVVLVVETMIEAVDATRFGNRIANFVNNWGFCIVVVVCAAGAVVVLLEELVPVVATGGGDKTPFLLQRFEFPVIKRLFNTGIKYITKHQLQLKDVKIFIY